MASSRRRKQQRKRVLIGAGVVAAVIAAGGGMVVASHALRPDYPVISPEADARISASAAAYEAETKARMEAEARGPVYHAVPAGSPVLILGDSFTEGYGADNKKDQGYAYLLAKAYGWNATVDGVGGTGFVWGGGKDGTAGNAYRARLERLNPDTAPALVILAGGSNDYRAQAGQQADAVKSLVEYTKSRWPNAQVVVMGPTPVQPHLNNLKNVVAEMASGARAADAFFIDPYKGKWFTKENSAQYAYTDGAHLNTAGYAYLASKVKETLDAAAASN